MEQESQKEKTTSRFPIVEQEFLNKTIQGLIDEKPHLFLYNLAELIRILDQKKRVHDLFPNTKRGKEEKTDLENYKNWPQKLADELYTQALKLDPFFAPAEVAKRKLEGKKT